jgi:ribosomal-protein-alanine N-acetyltransferase
VTRPFVRRAEARDVERIHAIARMSFRDPWEATAFHEELGREFAHLFVVSAGAGDAPVGFVTLWLLRDEAHVLSLAIHPGARRRGLASALLGNALAFARERGVRYASLEVRASNVAARELYARFGFEALGTRAGYYAADGEDAVVMLLSMPPSSRGHRHGDHQRDCDREQDARRDTEQSKGALAQAIGDRHARERAHHEEHEGRRDHGPRLPHA